MEVSSFQGQFYTHLYVAGAICSVLIKGDVLISGGVLIEGFHCMYVGVLLYIITTMITIIFLCIVVVIAYLTYLNGTTCLCIVKVVFNSHQSFVQLEICTRRIFCHLLYCCHCSDLKLNALLLILSVLETVCTTVLFPYEVNQNSKYKDCISSSDQHDFLLIRQA